MSYINRSVVWAAIILAGGAVASAGELYPVFLKSDSTGESGRVTFQNVGYPDGLRTFASSANPVIQGINLYAPDLVRVGDGWHNYFGGWLSAGDVNDRIYLGTRPDLEPSAAWDVQPAIDNGQYVHVHDPSVVREDGQWHMVYTAARFVDGTYKDWINYSSSTDGITWTPSAGTLATEIALLDPSNVAGGTVTDIARPSLVRTDTGWRMWFDGRVGGQLHSYLAESTATAPPTSFSLIHRYSNIENFPALMEPDMALRPDGTYVGVVQRHFRDLYQVTSSDGISFSYSSQPVLSATEPTFNRELVSNPGLVYDQEMDRLLGLAFGMTDSPQLVGHDIGFSYMQYTIQLRSPDGVWHVFAQGDSLDQQQVWVFQYDEFDRVRLIDPVTSQVLLEQDFSDARAGDVWELAWVPEPSSAAGLLVTSMLLLRHRARSRHTV